jgi:hypothetical protein
VMSSSALGEDLLRVSETLLMTDSLVSVSELKTPQSVGKRKFSGSRRRCEACRHIPFGVFTLQATVLGGFDWHHDLRPRIVTCSFHTEGYGFPIRSRKRSSGKSF